MQKRKWTAILAVFLLVIFGLSVAGFALPDRAVSAAERRKLAQRPAFSVQALVSGDYLEDWEAYLLDQFPARETFRRLKAVLKFRLLRQKDNNGIYLIGDSVFKLEYPLKERQVIYGAKKIEAVIDKYLQGMKVCYSIVPDKNYFAAQANGYPHMDYDRLKALMAEHVQSAAYIDLFDLLTLDDYYRTDTHWMQQNLLPVAQKLADELGLGVSLTPREGFTRHTLEPFYGVYWGQSALPVAPDVLTYLTSKAIDAAVMTRAGHEGETGVYLPELFSGMDGYNVFAAGPQAVVTITSPGAKTDKELIVFRDSFGSSLAPLLLEGYARVTLIDLRYISADSLAEHVEFTNQDVLFLYSTSLLNSAMILK